MKRRSGSEPVVSLLQSPHEQQYLFYPFCVERLGESFPINQYGGDGDLHLFESRRDEGLPFLLPGRAPLLSCRGNSFNC
jgi:hypothetical protein